MNLVNDVGVSGSIDWFNKNINSYYKSNLKIAHLNVNSIYGKSDEVLELLNQCRFDILFILVKAKSMTLYLII